MEFEEWVRRLMILLGYDAYIAQKNKHHGVDVLVDSEEGRMGIHVKLYDKNVGIKAVHEVIAGMSYYGCSYGFVITSSNGFTRQAQELARAKNIVLITKDDIGYLVDKARERNEKQ